MHEDVRNTQASLFLSGSRSLTFRSSIRAAACRYFSKARSAPGSRRRLCQTVRTPKGQRVPADVHHGPNDLRGVHVPGFRSFAKAAVIGFSVRFDLRGIGQSDAPGIGPVRGAGCLEPSGFGKGPDSVQKAGCRRVGAQKFSAPPSFYQSVLTSAA